MQSTVSIWVIHLYAHDVMEFPCHVWWVNKQLKHALLLRDSGLDRE